jgi:hypothetical protein
MSSLTIHSIDVVLDDRLTEEARKNKKSKNQLIKEILARSLGMTEGGLYSDDYREFCGVWTTAEHQAFEASQTGNASIDTEDWPS